MTSGRTASGVESLYPFLYAGSDDPVESLQRVTAQVRASSAVKAAEIAIIRAALAEQAEVLAAAAAAMAERFATGGRLLVFGNGGSSTDASSVAAAFLHPGPGWRPLPVLALTHDVAVLTALSNDVGFEVVFARQVAAWGRAGDMAFGLSTSGGSANVLAGLAEARRRGLLTLGFAGYDGGRMAAAGTIDHLLVVPSASVHRIQEAQSTAYHLLWQLTQHALGVPGP